MADEFGLTIKGDIIIINKETVDDFIDTLNAQFQDWEERVSKKEGKI
ncbi:MAG: hypothetical protein ACTSO9_21625 [Candidatus Helarchaeota archaeon]